jgi:hypothetical protein
MIRLVIEFPDTKEWHDWRRRCTKATEALIRAVAEGSEPVISDLYKEQQSFYFDPHGPFGGKCAYCEAGLESQPGDVEHFRPKGRVTHEDGKLVTVTVGDEEVVHPGYFWLAYDLTNLLPACADCNRPNSKKTGALIGKWDFFPIEGERIHRPGDVAEERPLLINPLIEDPSDHIEVDETGVLAAKTLRGDKAITMLGLNSRTALVDRRSEAYDAAKNMINALFPALMSKSPEAADLMAKIKAMKEGKKPFALALRAAIRDSQPKVAALMDVVTLAQGRA